MNNEAEGTEITITIDGIRVGEDDVAHALYDLQPETRPAKSDGRAQTIPWARVSPKTRQTMLEHAGALLQRLKDTTTVK